MASAFAQYYGGEKLDVSCGGSAPAQRINPDMAAVMAEEGLDMAFRIPQSIEAAVQSSLPEVIIAMGCGESCPQVPGAERIDWDLPDPAGESKDVMRRIRDEIKRRVTQYITTVS
jgi:protein-tyrosine-phosphatase